MAGSESPQRLQAEGLALLNQGDHAAAVARFRAAAAAFAAANDPAAQAEMLNNLGVVYRLQGDWPAAIQSLEQAAAAFATLGDPGRQAQALGNLGDLHAARRQPEEAARFYGAAAALLAAAGDGEKQSLVLRALSLLRLRQFRWLEALLHMEQSLRARPRPSLGQRLLRALIRFFLRLQGGG